MKKDRSNARSKVTNTRKTIRKQKRLQKKVHRQEHYMKKKTFEKTTEYTAGRFVKRPAESPETDVKVKKKKTKPQPSPQDILGRERQKDINESKKLQAQMNKQRKKTFLEANDEEDKIIKKLEKQLGLNKCKNKKNFFSDDGLDYLLEICDRATSEQIVAAEKQLANVEGESDFEEDLAVVTGKEVGKKKKDQDKERVNNSSVENETGDDMDDDGSDVEDDIVNEGSDVEDDIDDEGSEDFNEDDSNSEIKDNLSEASSEEDEQMLNIEDQELDVELEEQPIKSKKAEVIQSNKKKESQKIEINEVKKKNKEKNIKEDDLNKVFSDDELSHLSGDDDDMEGFSDDNVDNDGNRKTEEKPDVWEDIYGRKRDKEGNVIKEEKGTYVPPHLRNKDSGTERELAQLKRHIKSVLNKLAGTNLHWACTSIEGLYASNSRNAVNTTLAQLWMDAAVGSARTPDRLVAEHAALLAVLHANVAAEIGAHFLQELTKRFDEKMQTPQLMEDKTLDNLVTCLAHLYSFKIYHASLLYDIFGRLLQQLSEKRIDCVLAALRCVGGVLRKEDPNKLRTFIQDTQAMVAKANEGAADGSRIKFLLEVLMAVKNNNLNKIPGYEPTYGEWLRKQMRGIVRKGNCATPLNIRLEDLLKAEERGKWWVVGSAWEGERAREMAPAAAPAAHHKLLQLAKQQRMNTDVRRTIFCVIMAASDYMDAFEKLQQLSLRGPQQQEIVHVLLACCLQEKTHNPYYAVLAGQLCSDDRKYQLSIQYATWDKIKELENLPKHSVTNLAQFLVHLILGKGLPLSVLKVIQFSDLNKHTVKFMRQILLAIILNADVEASLEAFHRIAKPPKLHMFRESLRLFIQHFVAKGAGGNKVLTHHETEVLKQRTVEVDKILTLHDSKLRL